MAKVPVQIHPEFLQNLDQLLNTYEYWLEDHMYQGLSERSMKEYRDQLSTIRADMNRLIGQVERFLVKDREDLSKVHD